MRRFLRRAFVVVVISLVVIVSIGLFAARSLLLASLPRDHGSLALAGLTSSVTVERDEAGVPTISAGSLQDACRALGFVHAQERYFQMDGVRRFASGRLSELFGERTLDMDREMRKHRFTKHADEAFKLLPPAHQELLKAYADGVNSGLADLESRPPEYWALRAEPEAWRPEDVLLVECFMYHNLSLGARAELTRDALHATLPHALADFLTPDVSPWDSPIFADSPRTPPPIPGPDVIDLRAGSSGASPAVIERSTAGSNAWAVGGRRTADGRAMLANDMHLGLRVPNSWFRAQLKWPGNVAVGVTLPGVPGVIVGSTERVAWGFTNLCGDLEDHVVIEVLPGDGTRYKTPEGSEVFETAIEDLIVRGGPTEHLELRITRWGVVTDTDAAGRPLAEKWSALEPGALDVRILDVMTAVDAKQAIEIASQWRGPPQNVLVADSQGNIGWTISGWIPRRKGFDGSIPVAWSKPGVGWEGPIDEKARPKVLNPASGSLVTANNRTLPLDTARQFGANWSHPFRAHRIAELLAARPLLSERDMLNVQLDTKASLMERARELVAESVPSDHPDAAVRRARSRVVEWNGRADADQVGYRVLKLYVARLTNSIIGSLTKPAADKIAGFRYSWFLGEVPLRQIVDERPAHLLPRGSTWPAFFRDEFERVVSEQMLEASSDPNSGIDRVWGDTNRAAIRHPLSAALGPLAAYLDMPSDPLDGDSQVVRVTGRAFGASERLVVSPSHLNDAFFHMPTGQSGHPLSPYYRAGHQAWVRGDATPLLPGPSVSTFTLEPPGVR